MPAENAPRTAADIEAELMGLDFGDDVVDEVVDEVAAVTTTSDDAQSPSDDEARAIRQGWVPRERFTGDPKKWVDAKTFVERGDRFVHNLKQEVDDLRKQLSDFQGTKAAFVKFHEETIARKEAEFKEAIAALRVQRSEAQQNGDHEAVVQIEDRIDLLKDQQSELKKPAIADAPAPAPKQGLDMENPVLVEWIEDENQWFRDEPKLRDYAIAIGEQLISNGETVRGRPFLDKVTEIMRRDFPRRFKQQSGTTANLAGAAAGSGNGGGSSKPASAGSAHGKTERDLPPEDRALMAQFIREGWTTKEKFLSSYFSR